MRNQKGITLIALVITIIVLLILAGVSIAMLAGDNGVLSKSRQAKSDNELGAAKDQVALLATEALTNYYEETYVNSNNATYDGTALQSKIITYLSTDNKAATTVAPVEVDFDANTIELKYQGRTTKGTVNNQGKITWTPIANETVTPATPGTP